jgi:hypothetical protein
MHPIRRHLRSALSLLLAASAAPSLVHCGAHDGGETSLAGSEAATSGYTLLVSTSPSRASASALAGATLLGSAYVFTSDATKSATPQGIKQVRYWLDNAAMAGAPTHIENVAAYDFAGTAVDGSAVAWDTTKINDGTHTITEAVTTTGGAVQTFTAAFTVSTAPPPPPPPPPPSHACPSTAVLLSSFGAAGTGGDDTAVIQRAINATAAASHVLRVPVGAKPYNVGPITIPSHANVCFDARVDVEARSGWGQFDRMWTIADATNVTMMGYGATFHMNTALYATDTDPEYRHCVAILGSTNVHVAGMTCRTFGGDGLYVGGGSSKSYSETVDVEDFTSDGATRDGLTFISAKDAYVRTSHFNNGHTAVDMEPNASTDRLDNIHLEDSDSTGNDYGGVNVSIYALTSASTPPTVTVLRHSDKNTALGKTDFHAGTSFSTSGNNGIALGGTVLFDSCTSANVGSRAAWVAWWTANGPNVTFRNLSVLDPNQNGTAVDGAAVAVGRGGGGVGDQGNSTFIGTSVDDTKGKTKYYFTYYDGSGLPFQKVQWVSPGTLKGAANAPPNGLLDGVGVNSVNQ